MNIAYVAFARMPTEKAHGLTIAKSCESFARAGANVALVIPKRATAIEGDLFAAYRIERNFKVLEIRAPDLVGRFGNSTAAFWLHYWLFYLAVAVRLLFASRASVMYTREAPLCLLRWLGYKVVLEPHLIPKYRRTYFFLARQAFRIIPISDALKQAFVASGFEAWKILVAPSGVDLSVFDINVSKKDARKELGLPAESNIALYTGNFTTMGEDKGIHDTINALRVAADVTFLAVGGSKKDIERYSREAREAGVSGRVFLYGYAPQNILAKYQKAADVLVMPFPDTPHYRNHMSPVKMFEYMASGRPIIASDLPTIREILNGSNAHIVPAGNAQALAAALIRVGRATDDRGAIQARKDVESYTWDARAQRVLEHIAG